MTALRRGLGRLVEAPLPAPWIPPAPSFDLDAPILLPDVAVLQRVLESLRRL